MEAAIFLLVVVFVELALSVWLLARHREYLRRVSALEDSVKSQKQVMSQPDPKGAGGYDLVRVEGATDADMEQAKALLDALMRGTGSNG